MFRLQKTHIVFALLAFSIDSCKHEPEKSPCDNGVVYFKNDVLPLVVSRCGMSNCHGEASSEFPLTNYSEIMTRVEPGELEDSDLWEVINAPEGDSDLMPPVGSVPLNSDEISTIKTWIVQGAKENECNE